jgi:hypothetical protein
MKSRDKWLATMVIISVVTLAVTGSSILELRSSDELLRKIALIQPGVNLDSVKEQLGHQMYSFSDADTMRHYGSIKDPAFYQGKSSTGLMEQNFQPRHLKFIPIKMTSLSMSLGSSCK